MEGEEAGGEGAGSAGEGCRRGFFDSYEVETPPGIREAPYSFEMDAEEPDEEMHSRIPDSPPAEESLRHAFEVDAEGCRDEIHFRDINILEKIGEGGCLFRVQMRCDLASLKNGTCPSFARGSCASVERPSGFVARFCV